ncbi:hypothetical protein YSA_10882 [Pseudomonas putida ND6]|uniref:Uncharacterized protein n=1 Tax=Pseudomonas putida ND6 TaxID=231023 RepID=I3V4K1_PSEPU|nr:hypothetical protein YSA_10882 [Pseudomonas putida ND6]
MFAGAKRTETEPNGSITAQMHFLRPPQAANTEKSDATML